MFSTPLICCSIGVATVEATTSALAPGYCPDTVMTGGAISGYCATGRRENDTAPRITKTIETTAAKIGRSMKKWEMRIGARLSAVRSVLDLRAARLVAGPRGIMILLRAHLLADVRAHEAVDDHLVVRRDAGFDDPQAAGQLAERDVFLPHDVLAVDDQDVLARLLGADSVVRHEQRRIGRRAGDADAPEHAGREHLVRI